MATERAVERRVASVLFARRLFARWAAAGASTPATLAEAAALERSLGIERAP